MTLFGYEITRRQKPAEKSIRSLSSVNSWMGGLWGYIAESFAGAWQRNVTVDRTPSTLVAFSAVYACITGISSDIAKMRIKLSRNVNGIWTEIDALHANSKLNSVLKLLKKPNHYQNRIQFITQWILSKLLHGNAYILKERDLSGNVVALYVLHPQCVTPLVADDGSVFYSLAGDYLSQIDEGRTAPASEIIHDMMPALWHPLVGVSPLYACAMSVTMGNKIQNNSAAFFSNHSRPSGILTAPGEISDDTATRLKTAWQANYGGENVGKVAVLGDGLKFEAMKETAEQSDLVKQLQWTVSDVARTFHYPEFMLGGPLPPYAGNVDALITSYYSQCLQHLIESIELCLDEGLDLPADIGTECDLDGLIRMDTSALYESNNKAIAGGWMKPNEGRYRANLPPVEGGDSPMIQQQNYSLAALAKRDAKEDPFATAKPPEPTEPPQPVDSTPPEKSLDEDELELLYWAEFEKELIPA